MVVGEYRQRTNKTIQNVGMDETNNFSFSSVLGETIKVLQGGMMFSKVAAFL